jgi:zinc protease
VITKRRVLSVLALVLTIALAQPLLGQKKSSASDSIKIPFETYKLPNGLTVILSEDRTTPTVTVDVWYHVGSKNEVLGRTGFAHLF